MTKLYKSSIYTSRYTLPTLAQIKAQAKKLGKVTAKCKVAILASFTVSGLKEVLQVLANDAMFAIDIYEAPYKQYEQEMRNSGSRLQHFVPDITILLLDPFTILREIQGSMFDGKAIEEFIQKKTESLTTLIDSFIKTSKSHLVVSLIPSPPFSTLGISEIYTTTSQTNTIRSINHNLRIQFQTNKSVHFFDFNNFILNWGYEQVYDPKLFLMGDYFVSPLLFPQLGYELFGFVKASTGKTKKCIVLDLDNTLWGGIIGEDGLSGIKLGPEPPGNAYLLFQRVLLDYYNRGVLLAINSNNNEADVQEVFEKHPFMLLKPEHFSVRLINWKDKATNMIEIAKLLNLSLDALVFVDDDPKKRILMRSLNPQVLTIDLPDDPAQYAKMLTGINDFAQFTFTSEDLKRGKFYQEQAHRETLKTKVSDLKDYLQKLKVQVKRIPVSDFIVPRAAQLTQRTNQFNITTRRYTEADITKYIHDPNAIICIIEVLDTFGSYGIVGVAIVKKESTDIWEIDTFLLSCRVLGIEVENALLHMICTALQKHHAKILKGVFIPTAKNEPAADFFHQNQFKLIKKTKEKSVWELNIKKQLIPKPLHIELL